MKRSDRSWWAVLSVLVIVSLGLAACTVGAPSLDEGAPGGAALESDVPTATDPAASPNLETDAGYCGAANLSVQYAQTDVKTLVGDGFGFVSARVVSPETAFFNTADGAAPEGFFSVDSGRPVSAMVYTPYVVEIDRVLTGDATVGMRRVLVEGGVVGCFTMDVSGAARLGVDRSYVLVLADAKDVDGNVLDGAPWVFFAWAIQPSGIVGTVDGPLTIDALSDVIQRAKTSMPSP